MNAVGQGRRKDAILIVVFEEFSDVAQDPAAVRMTDEGDRLGVGRLNDLLPHRLEVLLRLLASRDVDSFAPKVVRIRDDDLIAERLSPLNVRQNCSSVQRVVDNDASRP